MKQQLEASFSNFSELSNAFKALGCEELIIKFLSKNQDNEKNQIYLGTNLSLAQYFPGSIELRAASKSSAKAKSDSGAAIVSLTLDFAWIWPKEAPSIAPNAKIIEYGQYPEVRLTGFLSQSPHAPNALRRNQQDEYGQRVLVLGVAQDKVFGAVVTEADSRTLVNELHELPDWSLSKLFKSYKILKSVNLIDPAQLLAELKLIAGVVHAPRKLKKIGVPAEYIPVGGQAGGWTLEALLNIPMNAKSAPDKYGFEIKAVGGERTSLITTEPDFGYRFENGVEAYINKFGRDAQAGNGKRVFSGIHRCNEMNSQTGAILTIQNWNFETQTPTGEGQPDIALIKASSGEIISGWTFAKIGSSWSKKHAGAVYVQSQAIKPGESDQEGYFFGPKTYVGMGTSAIRFLAQVANGTIVLDPGDTQHLGKSPHARTQWRISGNIKTLLPKRLSPLYDSLLMENLFIE